MSPRFSRILFDPLARTSRTASRSVTLPSPRVMRPLRSKMVMPSTWRVFTFILMSDVSLGPRLCGCFVFDQCKFGAGMWLAKVYLIHERPDQKDASSGAAKDVLGCERVGNG